MNQLDWQALNTLFQAALHGAAQPWVMVVSLVLCTFLLEDFAIAAGAAIAAQGALSWPLAFLAVAGGIALGDLGLYGLGLGARRIQWLRSKYIDGKPTRNTGTTQSRLVGAVLLARVVPGLRLVTYTWCGFVRAPFWTFTLWVLIAVVAWTGGLFVLSSALGQAIAHYLHVPLSLAVAAPIVLLALVIPIYSHYKDKTRTRTA